jgi:hypothetical protein
MDWGGASWLHPTGTGTTCNLFVCIHAHACVAARAGYELLLIVLAKLVYVCALSCQFQPGCRSKLCNQWSAKRETADGCSGCIMLLWLYHAALAVFFSACVTLYFLYLILSLGSDQQYGRIHSAFIYFELTVSLHVLGQDAS